jgi:hypothetical protein
VNYRRDQLPNKFGLLAACLLGFLSVLAFNILSMMVLVV